jgi:S-adenosylmethionine hydrolase
MDRPVVTLVTDFGQSEYVAAMKAAIWRHCPECRVVDVFHDVHHGEVLQGAHVLVKAVREFPEAVHIAVVDPGVGTTRRAVAVFAGDLRLVGPDNGILEPATRGNDVVVRDIELGSTPPSHVFHGRDLFAPAAARLARGDDPEEFTRPGPPLLALTAYSHDRFGDRLLTRVVHVDVFGNVQTPVPASEVADLLTPGRVLDIRIADKDLPARAVRTYADLGSHELGVLASSSGHVEVAMREAPAAVALEARIGDEIALDGA